MAPQLVMIWDVDETLILFHSLLKGYYVSMNPSCSLTEAVSLGVRWQEAILGFCDRYLFFESLEWLPHIQLPADLVGGKGETEGGDNEGDGRYMDTTEGEEDHDQGPSGPKRCKLMSEPTPKEADVDQGHAGAMSTVEEDLDIENKSSGDPSGIVTGSGSRLSNTWWKLQEVVRRYGKSLNGLLSPEDLAPLASLYEETDTFSGDWLSHATALLQSLLDLEEYQVHHVVVSSGQLVATLGKLMLFHLSHLVAPANVFSSSKAPKYVCFQAVADRFGPHCQYLVVGDGMEEASAAADNSWPFIHIVLNKSMGSSCLGDKVPLEDAGPLGNNLGTMPAALNSQELDEAEGMGPAQSTPDQQEQEGSGLSRVDNQGAGIDEDQAGPRAHDVSSTTITGATSSKYSSPSILTSSVIQDLGYDGPAAAPGIPLASATDGARDPTLYLPDVPDRPPSLVTTMRDLTVDDVLQVVRGP